GPGSAGFGGEKGGPPENGRPAVLVCSCALFCRVPESFRLFGRPAPVHIPFSDVLSERWNLFSMIARITAMREYFMHIYI
ncbi:hypothetical protein, partial [Yinghuangia sp. YIM S10712]|uniref:hypothetical protein n=1 Tax=Yinghuangia sp. YIM S10712 TaxID=3436930 RepID=UPI003F53685E